MTRCSVLSDNDSLRLEDERARREALDVTRSLLVQAPAGSGKTGLLIQRYLALLARVQKPEHILAMTFTRKAAGEMRMRVLDTLRDAQAQKPVSSDYEKQTRQLALAALAQDQRMGWRLLDQPSRMNVLTMDAFCMRLLKQTPILNRWGAFPQIDPLPHLRLAALMREALQEADDGEQEAWRVVLESVDNRTETLTENLARLLEKCEQWLPIFYRQKPEIFRRLLEGSLKEEVTQVLQRARDTLLPVSVALPSLMRFAAEQLQAISADGKQDPKALADALLVGAAHGGFPPASPEYLPDWQIIVSWLLTKQGTPRARLTKNDGFPSGKAEKSYKDAMMEFLSALDESAVAHLGHVAVLPRVQYREEEWQYIESILFILLHLYARFQLMCARDGVTTFTEVQLAALAALSSADDDLLPSELLLKLDMQVEHLLIDEFQDTSVTQEKLIEILTSGWQENDGRTLFAVGDPMQSIYRFRQAEVGIFLRAQREKRIGQIPVSLLSLTRNFRAQAQLVHWCNRVFPEVFPREDDILRGAVTFKPSAPERNASEETAVLRLFADEREEARAVIACIRQCQAKDLGSIAILVRGRAHLRAILPELRHAGIRFTSVKLDKLGMNCAVDDLSMLMRTLLQPNDELAWMSVLRAPWCGLLLADFVALSRARVVTGENGVEIKRSWFEVLNNTQHHAMLSESGQKRLSMLMQSWRVGYDDVHTESVAARVYDLWLRLHGPSFLEQKAEAVFVEAFFDAVRLYEQHGDITDWPMFKQYLADIFLNDQRQADEPHETVKIMTVHEAKGLEFDAVIVPGLAKTIGRDKTPLLRWRQRTEGLLLAARDLKTSDETASMSRYLKTLVDEEEICELTRLMYVAATRAREQLLLTATLKAEEKEIEGKTTLQWKAAPQRTMLSLWWTALNKTQPIPPPVPADLPTPWESDIETTLPLLRVTDEALATDIDAAAEKEHTYFRQPSLSFDSDRFVLKQVGVFVHRRLANIGIPNGDLLFDWAELEDKSGAPLFAQALAELGIPKTHIARASARAVLAMRRIAHDPFAQWLLSPERGEARNEWALQVAQDIDGLDDLAGTQFRIDRTFIDQGTRWIVDYKVADTVETDDIGAWLESQAAHYHEQMRRYALLFKAFDARPSKTILYFPLLQYYREVMVADG